MLPPDCRGECGSEIGRMARSLVLHCTRAGRGVFRDPTLVYVLHTLKASIQIRPQAAPLHCMAGVLLGNVVHARQIENASLICRCIRIVQKCQRNLIQTLIVTQQAVG